jgi:hypothetical protein
MNSKLIDSIRNRVADTRADLLALWAESDAEDNSFSYCFQDKDVEDDVLAAKGMERVSADGSDLLASWQGDIVCRTPKGAIA